MTNKTTIWIGTHFYIYTSYGTEVCELTQVVPVEMKTASSVTDTGFRGWQPNTPCSQPSPSHVENHLQLASNMNSVMTVLKFLLNPSSENNHSGRINVP